jgi:hypothetical protein
MDNLPKVGLKAQDKGLELLFDVPPELPLALRGDPLRLGQVLVNLGNNAVKFTDGVALTSWSRTAARCARTWVRDFGIGDRAQCEKMFKSWPPVIHHLKYGGTGLGWPFAKTCGADGWQHLGGQWLAGLLSPRLWPQGAPACRRPAPGVACCWRTTTSAREVLSAARSCGFAMKQPAGGTQRCAVAADQAAAPMTWCCWTGRWPHGRHRDRATTAEHRRPAHAGGHYGDGA